jgi:hypothetical protein
MIERRNRLRRIVMMVVGAAGLIALFALISSFSGKSKENDSAAVPPPPPPINTVTPVDAGSPVVPESSAKIAPSATPAPTTTTSVAPESSAGGLIVPDEKPDPKKAKALRKKAWNALNNAKNEQAIAFAKEAIQADPEHADAYMYWGSALMDMSKNREAAKVFKECVARAKKGPVGKCKKFAH